MSSLSVIFFSPLSFVFHVVSYSCVDQHRVAFKACYYTPHSIISYFTHKVYHHAKPNQ